MKYFPNICLRILQITPSNLAFSHTPIYQYNQQWWGILIDPFLLQIRKSISLKTNLYRPPIYSLCIKIICWPVWWGHVTSISRFKEFKPTKTIASPYHLRSKYFGDTRIITLSPFCILRQIGLFYHFEVFHVIFYLE